MCIINHWESRHCHCLFKICLLIVTQYLRETRLLSVKTRLKDHKEWSLQLWIICGFKTTEHSRRWNNPWEQLCIYRINEGRNSLENEPLGIHLQGILVGSLDAVENLLLVAVHGGILQNNTNNLLHRTLSNNLEKIYIFYINKCAWIYRDVVFFPRASNLDS